VNAGGTGSLAPVFAEAGPGDDADIRRLLREHPMPGAVSVSLEREPSLSVARKLEGGEHRTLACREGAGGALIAVGAVVTRPMLVNGAERRVAYLTQLRLATRARGRRAVIIEGYARMRNLIDADACFTSILEENTAARRLLERGLPGMPEYRFVSAFHTFVLGRGAGRAEGNVRRLSAEDVSGVARLLHESARGCALAALWTEEELSRLVSTGTLTLWGVGGSLRGCAGVWDLSAGKQAVVRGYSAALRAARGVINLTAGATGAPHLPAPGEPLRTRFLSHLALAGCTEAESRGLIAAACARARTDGASLIAGAAPGHPVHDRLSRHAWSTLRSRIYAVRWNDMPPTPSSWLDYRPRVSLEVAQL
jgi:hypothetical protein